MSVGLCSSALFGKPLVFAGSFNQQWMCCSVCVCVCRELAVEEVASLRLIWRGEQDEEKNCPYDWLGE